MLADDEELGSLRSVFVAGPPPVLHVNERLLPVQRAFILARELGFRSLGIVERPATSSWIKVESFADVLNNFRASYFAGALLMDRTTLGPEVETLFSQETWDGGMFEAIRSRYQATPEMFLYRLTELLPQLFSLEKLFFVRFHRSDPAGAVGLTKVFNLSGVPVPYGVSLKEHYCRRWPGVGLLTSSDETLPLRAMRSSSCWRLAGRWLSILPGTPVSASACCSMIDASGSCASGTIRRFRASMSI
jgi:hypothetical protein